MFLGLHLIPFIVSIHYFSHLSLGSSRNARKEAVASLERNSFMSSIHHLTITGILAKVLEQSLAKIFKLNLGELHQFIFDRVNLVVQLINLVGNILLVELAAPDDLGDKDKLLRVGELREVSEPRVLHSHHLVGLLLVTCLNGVCSKGGEGLGDDSNQEVEEKNDIEDATKEEHEPVTFSVVFQVTTELTKGGKERTLPCNHIWAPVRVVVFFKAAHAITSVCTPTWINHNYICTVISSTIRKVDDLFDREEGVSKGKDTNNSHDEENFHVDNTSLYHSYEPAEFGEGSQVKQESVPKEQGGPCLHSPESWLINIFIETVDEKQDSDRKVDQIERFLQVAKLVIDHLWDVPYEEVDDDDENDDDADVVLDFERVRVRLKVDDHNVGPVPENQQVD